MILNRDAIVLSSNGHLTLRVPIPSPMGRSSSQTTRLLNSSQKDAINFPMRELGEIAKFIGGEIRGDSSASIVRVVHPSMVKGPSDLALALSKKEASLLNSAVIINAVVPAGIENLTTPNQIVVSNPRL